MMEKTFKAMNSTIRLVDIDVDVQLKIEQMMQDFEQTASRFISNNELAFINHAPLNVPIFLNDTLADLLEQSLQLARKTDYCIHPFLGDAMKTIGYTSSFDEHYHPVFENHQVASKVFFQEPIEMLSANWMIKIQSFSFDFGGFGKGYIVDQVKKLLCQKGVEKALVNAGGDLSVIGTYEVGIEHPRFMGKDMIKLVIKDSALATSGKNYRQWKKNDQSFHHILNGQTGEPAFNGVLQASVIAKTVMEAETATKILCILPFEEAKALLYKSFPHIAYVVYFDNDQIAIGGDSTLYKELEVAS